MSAAAQFAGGAGAAQPVATVAGRVADAATARSVGGAAAASRYALSNAGAAGGVEDLSLGAAGRNTASVAQHLTGRTLTLASRGIQGLARGATGRNTTSTTQHLTGRTSGARAAGAVAATALLVLLALLGGGLASVVGNGHPADAERCQRASYEGRPHQPERLTSRDAASGQSSSQLVEGAVGSILAHPLPPVPKDVASGSPAPLINEGKYEGLQGLAQLPRTPLRRSSGFQLSPGPDGTGSPTG